MDLNAAKTAYTVFPMPEASSFWAAVRSGASALLKIKITVHGPGVVFRTKYKAKSGYQYFTVTAEGGCKETTESAFLAYIAKAAPPASAEPAPAAAPVAEKPVEAPEQPVNLKPVVKVNLTADPICCPHCKQVFALELATIAKPDENAELLRNAAVVKATDEQGKAALEAVTAAVPVVESAPAAAPADETVLPDVNDLGLRYTCVTGEELSMADIEAVETLIRKGAARGQQLLERLRASKGIALAFKDDTVVACLGYQTRAAEYIRDTNSKAQATVPEDALELSWVRVTEDYTGKQRDEIVVNLYETLRSAKANNPTIAGKAVFAVYNTTDRDGYAAMDLLGMRKHTREHKGITKQAQLFLA